MPIKKKKEKELSGENETWMLSWMLLVGQPAYASCLKRWFCNAGDLGILMVYFILFPIVLF